MRSVAARIYIYRERVREGRKCKRGDRWAEVEWNILMVCVCVCIGMGLGGLWFFVEFGDYKWWDIAELYFRRMNVVKIKEMFLVEGRGDSSSKLDDFICNSH